MLKDARAANAPGAIGPWRCLTMSFAHSSPSRHTRHVLQKFLLALLILSAVVAPAPLAAQDAVPATDFALEASQQSPDQSAEMVAREAQLLYLVNLDRQKAGIPPLRWNRELSEAARWLARDSVMRTPPTCGHTDTLGYGPGARMRRLGYTKPEHFAELVVCSFVEPHVALWAWVSKPDNDYSQKATLLDPRFREGGVGYFLDAPNYRGIVYIDLAGDQDYAPVVINLEAPSTEDRNVSLYIYPTRIEPVSIKVSSSPTFTGAEWQPYTETLDFTLAEGTGWRTVYVLTKDAAGGVSLASDSIWLGPDMPLHELTLDHASSIGVGYEMEPLPAGHNESVRFSLGWEQDDSDNRYTVYRGSAEAVTDDTAVAGTALRMRGGDRETLLRATFTALPANRILTLYVRLKTDNIAGDQVVAQFTLSTGELAFGLLMVRADDFTRAGAWQEFALDFVIPPAPAAETALATPTDADPAQARPTEIALDITHTGVQTVWLDTLRVYSQPVPANQQIIWPMNQTGLRSQAVQARLQSADGTLGEPFDLAFTPVDLLAPHDEGVPAIEAQPGALLFESTQGAVTRQGQVVLVCGAWCATLAWRAQTTAPWLRIISAQEGMLVYVEPAGLSKGAYQALITLSSIIEEEVTGEEEIAGEAEITGELALPPDSAQTRGQVQQTWVDVRLYVDGIRDVPAHEVNSIVWLPVTSK